jgi:ADP-ribose pyrophosphatase YjhB (NUDIX family)
MARVKDTFCSFCGTAYETPLRYPRKCASCGTEVWANPIPVSVVLLPVKDRDRTGLLVIRRAIPPAVGRLALVGGFVEEHETWAEAGAREVREETGTIVDAKDLEPLWFTSTAPHPNRVLLFAVGKVVDVGTLGAFTPDHETSERGLIFGPGGLEDVFAFSLHIEAARRYFAQHSIGGHHDYRQA